MKEIWVLSVKTSLPNTCCNSAEMETTFTGYKSFTEARDDLRCILRNFAFSKNSMFDGEGNIIYLKEYFENRFDEDDVCEDDIEILDFARMKYVVDSIHQIFEGKDIVYEPDSNYMSDWMIAVESKNGEVSFRGEADGPINGYCPDLRTNMFAMHKEKDYYLYIDDCFGQDDETSELYIDLKKVEI